MLLTARNDGLINSFNPVQLSAWHANVDMQYCVSRHKVIEYCAQYATKSEPHSQPLKEIFTTIMRSLKDDSTSLKAVQKLLINSIGERDYSAQGLLSTSFYSCPCSGLPGTLSCSALMCPVQ